MNLQCVLYRMLTLFRYFANKKTMKRIMSKEEFLSVYERQQASGLTIKDFMTCYLQDTESQSKRMAE